MNKSLLHQSAMLLVWVGAINWGLIGLFDFNLVHSIFGPSTLTQLTYILVGLAAVYSLVTHKDTCAECMNMGKSKSKKKK